MTDTATLITQLRILAQLTRAEAHVARSRVAQASTDDLRDDLRRNAADADARAARIGDLLRDLGAFPDPVSPLVGRVASLVRGAMEQAQPLDEALLGDLALEHQLRDRARYVAARRGDRRPARGARARPRPRGGAHRDGAVADRGARGPGRWAGGSSGVAAATTGRPDHPGGELPRPHRARRGGHDRLAHRGAGSRNRRRGGQRGRRGGRRGDRRGGRRGRSLENPEQPARHLPVEPASKPRSKPRTPDPRRRRSPASPT